MSNIATNIEQSKHLLGLGLSTDSADMFWMDTNGVKPCLKLMDDGIFNHRNYLVRFPNSSLPAWSLSALLVVMPSEESKWCTLMHAQDFYWCTFEKSDGTILKEFCSNNYTDAAYQMVCWLLEQGLIEKGGEE